MLHVLSGPLPLWGRALRGVSFLLAALTALIFITLPMDAVQQAILTGFGIVAFLVINRSKTRRAGLVLVVLSLVVTARYLFWRAADTLQFDGFFQSFLCLGLVAAEVYASILLLLSYMQTAYPLDRKPVPLPLDPTDWPTVDVYVPSYNEALSLVRPTVLAALHMDWPRDKMNVWILDDGRRPEFRAFAEECGCGYIIRPDNLGAKAGNINHALRHTDGEFVAIFDCDHAPTRAFLQMTVGWLVRDARIALVQTPHHFYSADPFERNLARKRPVPNEGLLFYGVIQPGNDLWNSAFFCGSCAVLRRTALTQIGGVPHETVTEDCHCSFRMQQRGWHTAYLRLPLAAGLATERLGLHIGQRLRWGRGMLQIARQENTLFARGLRPIQRLCYFASSFSFLFSVPRLVFLTAPLAFLFFGQNIIAASPLAITAYAGSHMFHTFATTARMNGRNRHSFWSEIYEAVMALPLLPVTLLTLWDPSKGKFNVTDKGGTLEQGYLDLRVVAPSLVLLALLIMGFAVGVWGISTTAGLEFQAYLLNTIWCGLCLVPVSAAIAVGREREQSRSYARVKANLPAELVLPDGDRVAARCSDVSLSGARMVIDRPLTVSDGDTIVAAFSVCEEKVAIPCTMLHWEGSTAFLEFDTSTLPNLAAVTRVFFGRPDAWLHWDDWPRDRPLHSLAGVVMSTMVAVFRKYRFAVSRSTKPVSAPVAAAPASTVNILRPRHPDAAKYAVRMKSAALALALLLGTAATGRAASTPSPRGSAVRPTSAPASPADAAALDPVPAPTGSAPAPAIVRDQPPDGVREVTLSLHELGLSGPMQMRGTSDLQGVLFGLRADEVVTAAKLTVSGGASPSLIPSLSQIAVTLNDQAVGTIALDPANQNFGPLSFDLDPLFFTEVNRLNFRFSGRYAVECNDPLSGLLWATVSDLSNLTLTIAKIPQRRDLSRLPEPFFDRRVLRAALNLPIVLPESTGLAGFRAVAIAGSWFSVLADYRGADFPVSRTVPSKGDAIILSVAGEAPPDVVLPRMDGPTLAVLPNPYDRFGTLLLIGGRTEVDAVSAALALAHGVTGLSGELARVQGSQPPSPLPYVGPRWLAPDHPVRIGTLVDRTELQSSGFSPGPIRVPFRTAPDIYTWRNGGLPVDLAFRAPPGPIVDLATSRVDVSVSDTYLRSFPLGQDHWPWVAWTLRQAGLNSDLQHGSANIPTYLVLGHEELQLRFDMRPLSHGECAAVPGDIHASVDPDSTVDISGASRYARMPNLGFFASAGFPFTRLADLSGTAAVLPEHPTTVEATAFLNLVGILAATTGVPATGLQVVGPAGLTNAASRDLLVIGAIDRQPAFRTLLRDSAVKVTDNRLTLDLPGPLQDVRAWMFDAPGRAERTRASVALDGSGEGMGILLGLESPLTPGRSVVAVTGMTPASVGAVIAAMRDHDQSPRIQGDVTLIQGTQVAAFRTEDGYDLGSLPPWLWAQRWLGDRPVRAGVLLVACGFLAGLPLFWMVRRRAAIRLRARTPK
jgi:cellulose synthase (UDP-forming)